MDRCRFGCKIHSGYKMLADKPWWPWALVIASFMFTSIRASADRCLSVFYMFWMQHYHVDYAQVSAVLSALYVAYAFAGLVVPVVIKRWSIGRWIILFSIISAVSAALASMNVPFWGVVILFGAVPGFCFGMQIPLVLQVVADAVSSERRVLAFQLVFMGYAVGPFLACPLWQVLISEYTWSGAMLIISSIFLHVALIGAVMNLGRAETNPQKRIADEEDTSKVTSVENNDVPNCFGSNFLQSIYHSLDLGMFFLPQTYLVLLFFLGFVSGLSVSASYIVPFGLKNLSLSQLEASFLPSAVAVGEIGAKLLVGIFFQKLPATGRKYFVSVEFLLAAVVLLIFPHIQSYVAALILCTVFGLLEGSTDGILVNYLTVLIPTKYFAAINSYLNVFGFVFVALINLISGIIVDQTGNVGNVFYVGAGMFTLAAFMMLILLVKYLPHESRSTSRTISTRQNPVVSFQELQE